MEPIIVNQDLVIISGHRRWLALLELNRQIEEEAEMAEEEEEWK
jgi:ParB-like chromosome segregation protein Spo0J